MEIMPVALFDERFSDLAPILRNLTDSLRSITGGTGSVPLNMIHDIQRQLFAMEIAVVRLGAEFALDAANGFANADTALKRRPGGPQSVADFNTAVTAATAAGDQYVAATLAMLQSMSMRWSKRLMVDADTGAETATFDLPNAVPASIANPWRRHKNVVALRDALIAAGG